MKIDGNQIKVGNILEINSKLWRVLKTQHTQPGKGGAYLQVEMKEIREGTKLNERLDHLKVLREQFWMKKFVNIYTLKIINLYSWIIQHMNK